MREGFPTKGKAIRLTRDLECEARKSNKARSGEDGKKKAEKKGCKMTNLNVNKVFGP